MAMTNAGPFQALRSPFSPGGGGSDPSLATAARMQSLAAQGGALPYQSTKAYADQLFGSQAGIEAARNQSSAMLAQLGYQQALATTQMRTQADLAAAQMGADASRFGATTAADASKF